MNSAGDMKGQQRTILIVKAYPLGVLVIGVALNLFVFGVQPITVSLPSTESIRALVIAAVLLVINHTWLMTTTELTRVRFKMFATPEEWAASGTSQRDAPEEGLRELERRLNAHRNTTENTIYFVFLAIALVLASPPVLATHVWFIGYAVARLGYTLGYLSGNGNARGLFMSLSLLAMYGIASYLAMSLIV
jgi:uncharacterized MAPEG superfamily protein